VSIARTNCSFNGLSTCSQFVDATTELFSDVDAWQKYLS